MENTKLKEVEIPQISTSAEETLSTVGNVVLVIGILAPIVFVFASDFEFMAFVLALGIFLSSLTAWAVLRVIANISLRLKAIQETIPRRMMTEKEFKVIQVNEQKVAERLAKCNVAIGETIIYKGKKYEVMNVDTSEGKLCINLGVLAGYVWVFPDEVTKVEE